MIYEPAEDSHLLEKEVKKYAKGKDFLDMGAGSGIQSLAALSSKAKSVTAVDIDPQVIFHIREKGIKAVHSDLFSNIHHKFDLISFNPPYLPHDKFEDRESALITSGGKKGDEITLKFLEQALPHLNKGGIILIVVSSLAPQNRINNLISKLKLKKEVLSTQKFFMEEISVWKLQR